MLLSDFTDPGTARHALESLDTVTTKPLYFWDEDAEGQPELKRLENHRLLFNATAREPVVPATLIYAVLPHAEAFARILDAVEGMNLETMCYLEDLGNTARLWLLFPDSWDEHPFVNVGIRITNSYDMSVSLQGDLVLWSVPNDSAIVLSRTKDLGLPPLALPHRAMAYENLEERVRCYIETARSETVRQAVDTEIERTAAIILRFQSDDEKTKLLREIFGKKLSARVATRMPETLSRWEFFRIVADVAHKEDLPPLMREIFRAKAEAFLCAPSA